MIHNYAPSLKMHECIYLCSLLVLTSYYIFILWFKYSPTYIILLHLPFAAIVY